MVSNFQETVHNFKWGTTNCMRKLGLNLPEDLISYVLQRGSLARDEPKSIRRHR